LRSSQINTNAREAALDSAFRPDIKALLVDAAGTLIRPSESVAGVYLRYAAPYGCKLGEEEILRNFRRAFNEPWLSPSLSYLRYEGDARIFWRHIVSSATGLHDDQMHADIYDYFSKASAWTVTEGAVEALQHLKKSGIKLAVVSNFDTRLRPILEELHLVDLFDCVVISAEVGAEKPNPVIFEKACSMLGVTAAQALVLGDDRRNDISGGRDAGCHTMLFGVDVLNFDQAAKKILTRDLF